MSDSSAIPVRRDFGARQAKAKAKVMEQKRLLCLRSVPQARASSFVLFYPTVQARYPLGFLGFLRFSLAIIHQQRAGRVPTQKRSTFKNRFTAEPR